MKIKPVHLLYWSIPAILWIGQSLFTVNSNTQIRYEELADSIRNVFWLEQHKIYDGVSNGVGWYSTLLIVYKLFGFSLFSAKYFRLFIALISIFSLSWLLFKYLGSRRAIVPLLTIGLSPTMLFLNSTQTEYALDLQMLPIYLSLALSINCKSRKWWLKGLQMVLLWVLVMVGAMAYPTFLYYVPLIGLIFLWKLKSSFSLKYLIIGLISFLLPLMAIFAYLDEAGRSLLIYDPRIGGGIFRGAGSFEITGENISKNLGGLFNDLFVKGSSYHFEVNQAEFSLIFPVLAIALVFYYSYKNYNRYILLALISGLAALVLSSLTLDPSGSPGMRRYTPVLAAFYTLFVLAWQQNIFKKRGMVILSLLLVHHLIVYPINLIHLKDPSPEAYPIFFNIAETPAQSLNKLVEKAQQEDLKLVCDGYCRVVEAYAAVAGSCVWNHLACHQILGWDQVSGQLIPLEVDLWSNYYLEH